MKFRNGAIATLLFLFTGLLTSCGELSPNNQPLTPATLTGSPTPNGVLLQWSDASGGSGEYELERRVGEGSFELHRSLPAGVTWFEDKDIAPGVNHSYRVRQVAAARTSPYSNVSSVLLGAVSRSGGGIEAERGVALRFGEGAVGADVVVAVVVDVVPSQPYRAGVRALAPSTKFRLPWGVIGPDISSSISMTVPRFAHVPEEDDDALDYAVVFLSSEQADLYAFLYAPYDRKTGETRISTAEVRALAEGYGLPADLEIIVEPVDISQWKDVPEPNTELGAQANTDHGLFRIHLENYSPSTTAAKCDLAIQNALAIPGVTSFKSAERGEKPVLVLVHGWQVLVNYMAAAEHFGRDWARLTYLSSPRDSGYRLRFAPQVCDWQEMLAAFKGAGMDQVYEIYSFAYDSDDSVESNANRLNSAVAALGSGTKVTFVAHSMGGMVANAYLHKYGSGSLNHLITLGTPFRGSPAYTCKPRSASCASVNDIFGDVVVMGKLTPFLALAPIATHAAYTLVKTAVQAAARHEGTKNLAWDHPDLAKYRANTSHDFSRYTAFYGFEDFTSLSGDIFQILAFVLSLKRGVQATDGVVPVDSAQLQLDGWNRIRDTRGLQGLDHGEVKGHPTATSQIIQRLREVAPPPVAAPGPTPPVGPNPPAPPPAPPVDPLPPAPPAGTADLYITQLRVAPTTAAPGGELTVNFSITNGGTARAGASLTRIRINQNSQNVTTSDALLAELSTPAIAAGASSQVERAVRIPAGLPDGTYYVWVTADVRNEAGQSNYTNDRAATALTVRSESQPPPQTSSLEATPASLAFVADVGQRPAERTFTLSNSGDAASNFTLSLSPSWVEVGTESGTIRPGGSVSIGVRPDRCDRRETLTGLLQFRDAHSQVSVAVSLECTNAAPTTGTLDIRTSGIPRGFYLPFGTVSGPDRYYEEVDSATLTLSVPAGRYTVQMDGFRYGTDVYRPNVSTQTVTVTADRTTRVNVTYAVENPNPPVTDPVITGVSPASPAATFTPQSITISGRNFAYGAGVVLYEASSGTFYDVSAKSSFVSSTQISVSNVAFGTPAGRWEVMVRNDPQGTRRESNWYAFNTR